MIRRLERFIGSITIVLLLTAAVLFVADRIFGLYLERYHPVAANLFPKDVYFEPRPYVMIGGTRDREIGAAAGLNELGYRGPVPIVPKPEHEMRIAVIGGSTVLIGAPTVPELLEERFVNSGMKEARVYNFGVSASTLRMDLARLVFELSEYSPDLILFYGGGNDIGMPFQADPRPGYPPNFLAYEFNPLLTAGTARQSLRQLAKLALFESAIVRAWAADRLRTTLVPLDETRARAGWNTPEWSRRIAEQYRADMALANRLAGTFGARAVFVFQPILAFKAAPSESERALLDPDFVRHAHRCRTHILEAPAAMRQQDVLFFDASTLFDDEPAEVFTDGVHVRQEFQPRIADAVFEAAKQVANPAGARETIFE